MKERANNSQGCAVALAVGAVVLPVLYVLSTGPAGWLYSHGWLPAGSLHVIYHALELVRIQPFHDFMQWYLDLWGGIAKS